MIAIDVSRTTVSWRASGDTSSAALASNALHFGGDLAGSVAVLVGLLIARAGYPNGDSVAALFVAVLVLAAASRLIRSNIDVLMDRAPADAEAAARAAIAELTPAVELRRLRMRQAGGRQFADVVIGVSSIDGGRPGTRRRRRRRGGAGARASGQRRRRARRAARRIPACASGRTRRR